MKLKLVVPQVGGDEAEDMEQGVERRSGVG